MNSTSSILLTGGTGLVGGFLLDYLGSSARVIAPSRREMNIAKRQEVQTFVETYRPDVIIHAAAFTDNDGAERERGNKNGSCWQVNVEGTRSIVEAGKKSGAYIIYISTGSVFAGTHENPGPFTEDDLPTSDDRLSWYGVTKREAEQSVHGAIIRLSHPVARREIFDIPPLSNAAGTFDVPPQDIIEAPRPHPDYIQHLVQLFDEHRLYPLFTDQLFPITYLDDVVIAIKRLLETRKTGIFHLASYDTVTPWALAGYAIYKARHVEPVLPETTFDEFIKHQEYPLRFSKYSAISSTKTARDLRLPVRTWKEIVDCLYEIRKV